MTTEYKTKAELQAKNKNLKFQSNSEFFVLFVKDPGQTITKQGSSGSWEMPIGTYLIYCPDFNKVSWIKIWMILGNERSKGDIIHTGDFKEKFPVDAHEWKDPEEQNIETYETMKTQVVETNSQSKTQQNSIVENNSVFNELTTVIRLLNTNVVNLNNNIKNLSARINT